MTTPSFASDNEGSFTVTIPLGWMTGMAPRCRLYVTAGGAPIGRFDMAPIDALEIGTNR